MPEAGAKKQKAEKASTQKLIESVKLPYRVFRSADGAEIRVGKG